MASELAPQVERVGPPRRGRLLLALSAAPTAWAVQEGLSAFISVRACDLGQPAFGRGLIIALGVVALAVTLGTWFTGYRVLQRSHRGERIAELEGRETEEMLALVAVLIGVLLSCAVIWNVLPSLFIGNLCEARR